MYEARRSGKRGPLAFALATAFFAVLFTLWSMPTLLTRAIHPSGVVKDPVPALGYELSTSYGHAVIRYPNKTFEIIATVNTSQEYRDMMRGVTLNDASSSSSTLWTSDIVVQTPSLLSQLAEEKPSIPVMQMALLIANISSHVEKRIGFRPTTAVVANPLTLRIGFYDVAIATAKAGLQPMFSRQLFKQPHFLSTSYASYGLGLCEDYEALTECRDIEDNRLPDYRTLVVTYNRDALHVQYGLMRQARRIREDLLDSFIDWNSGSDALLPDSSEEQAQAHWKRVRAALLEIPMFRDLAIDVVVVSGESGNDTRLEQEIQDAFKEYQDSTPKLYIENTFYANAIGAAELAFRCQYDNAQPRYSMSG